MKKAGDSLSQWLGVLLAAILLLPGMGWAAENQPPVAVAANLTTKEDTPKTVVLKGVDPEKQKLTFSIVSPPAHGKLAWKRGAMVYTPDPDYFSPEGSPDSFTFKANDGQLDSSPATVSITVQASNDKPLAQSREVLAVRSTAREIALSGSDVDSDTLTYKPDKKSKKGGTVVLKGGNVVTYTPKMGFVGKDFFNFSVRDGKSPGKPGKITVVVRAENTAPLANAGEDFAAAEKATVLLDGSASSDEDGNIVSYEWMQIAGTPAVLQDATTATPTVTLPDVTANGTLTFRLEVRDNNVATGDDTVVVSVNASNAPPTANAGDDQQVDEGATVNLSGSGTDPDGDTVTYSWAQTDSSGVTATLTGATTATPSFTAPAVDADTTLTFTLTVSDGHGGTATDTVNVVVKNVVAPPPTATGRLNDTGVTKCGDYAYNTSGNTVSGHSHSNSQDCNLLSDAEGDPIPPTLRAAGTGQDGYTGRDVTANDSSDGHAGFSFTKVSSTGAELPATATDWSCVKDNITGLIWEVKTDDGGLHDKDDSYTWYEPDGTKNGGFAGYQKRSDYNASYSDAICYGHTAGNAATYCNTKAYVNRVNAAGWCGATDWRLPRKEELRSIVSYDRYYPAIDTAWFPNTPQYAWFWSASPVAYDGYGAWGVSFGYGNDGSSSKGNGDSVRLVRSGQ